MKILLRVSDCGITGTTLGADALDREFSYDPLYRVTSGNGRESDTQNQNDYLYSDAPAPGNPNANNVRAYTRQYSYDKIGNVQQVLQPGVTGFTRNFVYNTGVNTLQKIETGSSTLIQNFTYDAVGNQITAGTTRNYVWNAGNQLITYYNQAGMSDPTIFAQYDYSGMNRVSKMVRTGTAGSPIYERTIYIDGIFEYHILENGTTYEKNYVHVMDDQSRIAMVRVGTPFPDDITEAITYNLEDQIGSSTVRLKTTGAVIDKEEYYPFGDSSLRTFTKKRYRFTGKERDSESGLYYYGARYYSPWTCRFISCDPLQAKYPNISTYAYVFNNPLKYNDPTGMDGKPVNDGPTDNLVINDFLSVAKDVAASIGSNKLKFGISPKTGTLFTDDGSGLVQNIEAPTVIGNKDYRTSGDKDIAFNGVIPEPEKGRISYKNMVNQFDEATGAVDKIVKPRITGGDGIGTLIMTLANVASSGGDLNDIPPMDMIPVPGAGILGSELVRKWDNEMFQFEMNQAESSWNDMKKFASKWNTNNGTAVIFVYAAMDIHENTFDMLNSKIPTTTIYKTADEAKASLGFVPRIVYYQFISPTSTNLVVYPMNKLKF